jgi:DNA helicase-2/ATP-dependent DNA helicase PcrA
MKPMSKNWSEQQFRIFNWFRHGRGNLIVRARAGTGKTTTILEAVTHAPENKILLAAFNKRIARELEEKLGGWKFGAPVEAKTLHGLGYAFVKGAWGKDIQPDDDVETDRIRVAVGTPDAEGVGALVGKLVSRVKNAAPFATAARIADLAEEIDAVPTEEMEDAGWGLDRVVAAAVAVLNVSKVARADRKISFDDMVWLPVVLRLARPWYQMVVIDEAQDMNASQLLLAQAACKRGGRIVVVGDDRQAIYGFRGADSGSIDRLKTELRAEEMGLTVTYRCGKKIVARAQELVPDYQAAAEAPEGLVDGLDYELLVGQARPGDFVLSRKNAPLMSTCLRLLRAGIPARIEGKDIGKSLAVTIKKFRARSVPDFLKRLAAWQKKESTRITAKGKNVDAKLQVVNDQFETLAALADGAANVDEIVKRCYDLFEDSIDPVTGKPNLKPAVICSSVHKAKGLEADRVFVLVDTLSKKKDQEELNIEYVAITRAKRHLTLVTGQPGQKAAS